MGKHVWGNSPRRTYCLLCFCTFDEVIQFEECLAAEPLPVQEESCHKNTPINMTDSKPAPSKMEEEAEHFAAGSDVNFRTAHKAGFLAGHAKAQDRIRELERDLSEEKLAAENMFDISCKEITTMKTSLAAAEEKLGKAEEALRLSIRQCYSEHCDFPKCDCNEIQKEALSSLRKGVEQGDVNG